METPNFTDVRKKLSEGGNSRRDALEWIGQWAKNMCLLFGAEQSTAWRVGAELVKGLEREWERIDQLKGE